MSGLVVAVAGMHRSGTSMFARYLHESGVCMGERLHVDLVTNPYGHYEDLEFLDLQRTELARAFDGEDYLVSADFASSRAFLDAAAVLVERRRRYHGDRPWGWKDPRTTLFLPQWLALVPELRVVAMLREPRAVLSSLCRRLRTYFSIRGKERILRAYTHYNARLAAFRDRHPARTSIVVLEELVAAPDRVLAPLGETLGIELDPARFRAHYDARALARSRRALVWFNRASHRRAVEVHARLRGHPANV